MIEAVNWDNTTSDFAKIFWDQNTKQFWLDTEIPISKDKKTWEELSDIEQDVYMKVLGGLTLLDTEQGGVGMPLISMHVQDLQEKAVLTFMAAMEQVHAKSYSTIFTTLASKQKIEQVFEWVKHDKWLQDKSRLIESYYKNITDEYSLAQAMIASVFLESYMFYSGFFYPLLLAGQGKLKNSGEIISLIIRDESIHGVFVGLLYQKLISKFSAEQSEKLRNFSIELLNKLYEIECRYTEEIYDILNLSSDVKKFIRYNANKALMNLGYEPHFANEEINSVVLNGLSTETRTHDFFSQKGNGYAKIKVEPLKDEDFEFIYSLTKK
ncbi:class 1b ribonucleoside-diphosphate reductase subunit beta [Paenibacillus naphthalenovorans]|uniref:Ribonucleoside-diphosphate reductase subunit beta n=1 Tax=Paenibacillus naphthalenovorans TaxID=162209 RepID=A0A0U2W3X4_9BACL|nr:class 1b ribonucleoside-diphosphate reductase subunit beta [Paenibacillus naphthalenovorans]ALS22109.1 ribonucleotide-diphosphate reductase [Paenibacillus naphthalenovorans]